MAGKSSKKKKKGGAPEAVGAGVAEMKEGIRQMESFMKEAAAMAASEMRRIDEITANLGETVARLEAGIREKEEMLGQKEASLKELQERLSAQIRNLEDQIREKERLLAGRELEMADLRSKLEELEASYKGSVPLTEENVVLLEEVEPGVGDGLHPMELIGAAGQDFETGREPERKAKVIEQSMRGVVVKLSKMAGREGEPAPKKSTLLSLLSPMKKRS